MNCKKLLLEPMMNKSHHNSSAISISFLFIKMSLALFYCMICKLKDITSNQSICIFCVTFPFRHRKKMHSFNLKVVSVL